ncbi:MAG: hypothetical protein H0T79_05700 [Deltaproteobacteria bacterium]|nr:hypothetical protein [Deltaproteobacteria bacterium]
MATTGSAIAGPALDEGGEPTVDPTTGAVVTEPVTEEAPVEYGVGLRLRNTRVPQGLLELFVERSGGGASNVGIGGELIRRRGNVELQLGFEFEKISVGQGVWIEKGKNVPLNEADFVLGDDEGSNLGWFTIEFTFMNHAPINKYVSFRYGGGAGIGFLTGDLLRYNIQCSGSATNANPDPGCYPRGHDDLRGPSGQPGEGTPTEGGDNPVAYDLPPVFPVVNAIIGVQIKPTPQLSINLEAGIRLLPFFGMSTAYFF